MSECVTNANSNPGSTISVSSGDGGTWESTINITAPMSIIASGGPTITAGTDLDTGLFKIAANTTEPVRISGFNFDCVHDNSGVGGRYAIDVAGDITQLRIDHNTFNSGFYQINLYGKIYGVIDNNTFTNGHSSIQVLGGTTEQQAASWGRTINAGSAVGQNTLYIENNNFIRNSDLPCGSYDNHIESRNGWGFVVRHNTFDGTDFCKTECASSCAGSCYTDYHVMTHGNGPVLAESRGHVVVEVYNNTFKANRLDSMVFRGSSNLIHDNTFTTSPCAAAKIHLREEEADGGAGYTPQKTAWPAADQIFNTFLWENYANTEAVTLRITPINSYCTAGSPSPAPYSCCTGIGTGTCDFIVENQDYFMHSPASSGGKETLYNDGTLNYTYLDDSHKMTFSATGSNAYYPYTPYTYPHPLRGSRYKIGSGPQFSIGTGATVTIQ